MPTAAKSTRMSVAPPRKWALSLNMQAIKRQPSTLRPHALLKQAAEQGVQDPLAEALFKAYFIDGRDLTNLAELRAIAAFGRPGGRAD